ncbi:hypothetical protein [Cognaticolwellia mytili]
MKIELRALEDQATYCP